MSLINDALKRASQSDKDRQPQAETQGRLKAVDDSGPSYLRLALLAGILIALAFACLFFWRWWQARQLLAPPKRAPVVAVAPQPAPPPGVVESDTQPSASTSAPAPSSPAKPAEEAWPADLKVMGIIFNPKNPLALINGETVGVGGMIDGIRITKIDRDQVTVQWKQQVKVLVLK
jgi:cytoskeletal protein RodZ